MLKRDMMKEGTIEGRAIFLYSPPKVISCALYEYFSYHPISLLQTRIHTAQPRVSWTPRSMAYSALQPQWSLESLRAIQTRWFDACLHGVS